MKTKLLIGLLVFALLAVMISGLLFMSQQVSPQLAKGQGPPQTKPGCLHFYEDPDTCVAEPKSIPIEMVKGDGPPQDKPGCIHWAEDPDTCFALP